MTPATPEILLRTPSPELLSLPWDLPLEEWSPPEVPLRDISVGPSRHLVKFVEADEKLWAVKEMSPRLARKEYEVLRKLEDMDLAAVRPAGLVIQPGRETAILVTRFLEGSWQYRRLLMRLPPDRPKHRARLLDAMVGLLVDLHRHGVFWGDCSLANTLFTRDGQVLQAWFVDAETSEVHPQLSDGQRRHDIEILTENVAMGMIDLAVRLERPPEIHGRLIDEAQGIADRYTALWELLHEKPTFAFDDRYRIEGTVRRLNELGFVVEEISLQPVDGSDLRLNVRVGGRGYHSRHLRDLTSLTVGEGQATILLADLHAYQGHLSQEGGEDVTEHDAAARWVVDVLKPGEARAHAALDRVGSPIQAYCDLLEVRWLRSEEAGHDIGFDAALDALSRDVPTDSAAKMSVAEAPTGTIPAIDPDET